MPRPAPSESTLIAGLVRAMASSAAPLDDMLELAMSCVEDGATGAAVLKVDSDSGSWSVLASNAGFDAAAGQALTAELDALVKSSVTLLERGDGSEPHWDQALPLQGGEAAALRLHRTGSLLGIFVLLGCSPERWATVPYSVSAGLTMCLGGAVVRDTARFDALFAERSARAIRRLFEEGAHARDVEEAGAVVARVAAEAFETERAGMYVVDSDGLISFAIGVGIAPELSDALTDSLVGKVAAESPVWQALERVAGPSLVDDATTTQVRPGGFVQTLSFKSYVAIPLLSNTGPLGMVICGDASHHRSWSKREHRLAKQFALEGALIIDAARLRASERAQLARITHQAFHDGLTGIPNRNLLIDRLDRALAAAARTQTKVAMLVLDLDDFKKVNDTLGHRYGDELLREVAHRLMMSLRGGDTLARLGGDEFAILLSDDADLAQARAVAARVDALLSVPVDLDGISLNAVASVGIAMYPDHAATSADLLQRADIAMYAAKAAGNGPMIYDPSQDDSTLDKLTLYTDLRRAIAEDELVLAYQPKLDLHRNAITGVEALVRWRHPRRGLLAPSDFLPMAESTGLIHSLTAWVLRRALEQWADWASLGVALDLAVNISARNLLDRTLMTRIADLARTSGIGEHLVLEVTETAVMRDPAESVRALAAMRALGVRVSMDDFGTGYSSLALLGQLPVDELKVDRQLVQDVETNDVNTALIEAVVGVGHRLGLTVVAEGIETAQTLQAVRELGCDLGQGYFISHPVSPEEVVKLLEVRRLPLAVDRARAHALPRPSRTGR
jgi:diguanylate cyclase (GGDEF)-like protein